MPIRPLILASAAALALAAPTAAEEAPANPQIDYSGFVELAGELAPYREARRLPLGAFHAKAREDGAIILDARSAAAFAAGHIDGAVNLPFSDFTQEKLAKVLGPVSDRPVLIYCSNNFADDAPPVPVKRVELALNIPTFINLYGYGYRNIWELADMVETGDPRVNWVVGEMALAQ